MANSYLYTTVQRHLKHRFGRGSIMSDVDGNYYISCYKHPEIRQPAVKVGLDKDVLTELKKAFDNCPGCIEDEWNKKAVSTTRFPEGAEL